MHAVELAVNGAMERDEKLSLAVLGGERLVLSARHELAHSPAAADIAETALNERDAWTRPSEWEQFFVEGLSGQADRVAMAALADVLAKANLGGYRSYGAALVDRAKDASASDDLRMEAAACLLRFALLDKNLKFESLATLENVRSISGPYAGARFCRLAAVAFEQFAAVDAIDWLKDIADSPAFKAEAKFELAMVVMNQALNAVAPDVVMTKLSEAQSLFGEAEAADEDRRDARTYSFLLDAILALLADRPGSVSADIQGIKNDVWIEANWSRAVAGYEWLVPPPMVHRQWVHVIDALSVASQELGKPSWLNAGGVLAHVTSLYALERSVCPGLRELSSLVKPKIESRFLEEKGLLAHLDAWIESDAADIPREDAETLRANIRRRAETDVKPSGAITSRRRSPKR